MVGDSSDGRIVEQRNKPQAHKNRTATASGAAASADDQALRLIRGGITAIFVYAAMNFGVVAYSTPRLIPALAPIFGFDLSVTALALGLTWSESYRRHWRPLTFGLCVTLVLSATAISLISDDQFALFIAILLLGMGTAIVAPWGPRWQFAFSALCVAAMGLNARIVPSRDAYGFYRWLAILTGVALAQFAAAVGEGYRRRNQGLMAKLRENEEKLWKVFEANPDVVTISRFPDGRYLDVSGEFLTSGYTREDAIGATDRQLGVWAHEAERKEFNARLRSDGQVRNLEATFRTRQGVNVPCLISGAVVQLSQGPCVIAVTRDISQIKQAEEQLIEAHRTAEAASRAKSDFLSSMSHEIRTPMNSILGMAELLNDTPLANDQRKYLSIMINNGNALLDLINDILDFARVESGKLRLETAEFDLVELVERVAETFSIRAHQKGLELAVRVAPDVPATLMGDALRLRQVLVNLIGNALKFTDRGAIALEIAPAADAPGMLHFSVADSGIGVPADQRERIFASYAQAESSTARKYGGTGLGLAIVKQLVELMGGNIWVESEVGRGSTFHFTARLAFAGGAVATAHPTGGAETPDLAGARVLIIDDTAVNRIALGELLAARGALITAVASGAEALAALGQAHEAGTPYRLALLDCGIPGADALELARRIRRQTRRATLILPMLTTDELNVKLLDLRKFGLNHHVIKPVRRGELMRAITALLTERCNSGDADPAKVAPPEDAAAEKPGAFRTGCGVIDTPAVNLTASAPVGAMPAPPEAPIRILVADDSRDNRLLIEAFLRKTPWRLEPAENGEVAVRKFIEGHFDVVLMDIQMPVMDGYEATRIIREWEREHHHARTPIIALTASVLDEAVHKSFAAGCDTHVSKPVRRPTLIEAIHEVMAKAGARPGCAIEAHGPEDGVATTDGARWE